MYWLAVFYACWTAIAYLILLATHEFGQAVVDIVEFRSVDSTESLFWFRVIDYAGLLLAAVVSFVLGLLVSRLLPRRRSADLALLLPALIILGQCLWLSEGRPSRSSVEVLLVNAIVLVAALTACSWRRRRSRTTA